MSAAPAAKRFVIDTDPGVDDAFALAYVAARPDLAEIVAVGTAHGNVDAKSGADNAMRLLAKLGLADVPVAIGANLPLNGECLRSAQHVHGVDGFGGHAGPASGLSVVDETAAEQLVRLARAHPGQLSLLALAPLTNVALALQAEPALPRLLREVIWMGGSIAGPGNITAYADANSWHDPEAAEQVLSAGFTLTMVPLDVTTQAWAGQSWWDKLAGHDHPFARYAAAIACQYLDRYSSLRRQVRGENGCLLHDPVAAAIALDPDLATYQRHPVVVELAGTHTRGATLVDRRIRPTPPTIDPARRPVTIATSADISTVLSRLHEAVLL